MSRKNEVYEESKIGLQEDGETAEAVAFVCAVSYKLNSLFLELYTVFGIWREEKHLIALISAYLLYSTQ